MLPAETDYLWHGTDAEGVQSFIAHDQWHTHILKRVEITDAIDLTVRAITQPQSTEPDRNRPDETTRYFRILTISAQEKRPGYDLRVSVKYVRQPNGAWFKFFQSCWFERKK